MNNQPTYISIKYAAAAISAAWKTAIFLGALIIFLPLSAFAFGIGAAPMTTEMDVKPGQFYRKVIKIANSGSRNLRLTVGTADWKMDTEGDLVLKAPNAMPRSGAEWLNFSPSNLLLKPQETKNVIVDIQVPVKIEGPGVYRAALLIKTMLPPEAGKSETKAIWNLYELASLFYMVVAPAAADTKIISTALEWSDPDQAQVIVDFENSGARHDRIHGNIVIKGTDHKPAASLQISDVVVLDHWRLRRKFNLSQPLSGLPPGEYSIEMALKSVSGKAVPGFSGLKITWHQEERKK